MDRAPLPPHERPWRHPSELGPPEHEPTSTAGRVLIVTTATLSLALVGLLVLTATPERAPTTAGSGAAGLRGSATTTDLVTTIADRPALTTAATAGRRPPLVTPVGDEGWGLMTVGGANGRLLAARMPSGRVVDVEIVGRDVSSGLTVVSLPEPAEGYDLAASPPTPTDTVLVTARPPQVVTVAALVDVDVDDGTAVLDDDGHLVGLCANGDDGTTALRTVGTMPGSPTTEPDAAPTTRPPAERRPAPPTAAPPATAATSTTGPSTTTTTTTTSVAGVAPGAPTTPGSPTSVSDAGASTTAPG